MADLRLFANTSNLMRFVLKHATTGQGLPGLTSASSGLIISTIADNEATATAYTVAGSTIEGITTLGTFATPTATKCRFKEVDATNHKGLYEFQFADARFAVASSRRLIISVTGATNLLDTDYEIQLVQFNPYDTVRLGLTALPNAAAEAAGGLFTRGTGAGQVNQAANGMIDTNPVRLNNVSQSLLDLKDFADDGYDPATNKVQGVVLTDTLTTYTGNTLQTGDSFARLGAPAGASVSADIAAVSVLIAAVKAKTDQLVFTIANKVDSSIQAAGDFAQAAADKAWSTATRILTAGTNIVLAKGTGVTGFNDLSAAQVNTEADTALTDYDAPTSAELVSEINAVQVDIAALNNLSAAQVNAEVDTALSDINLDHLVGTATGIPSIPAGTYIDQIMDDGTATYDRTTDSLQAIRDRGDSAWDTADVSALALQSSVDDLESRLGTPSNLGSGATVAANLVDIEAQTDDIGTAGAGLTNIPWNSSWDAEVQSEVTDALNAYDPPTSAELVTEINSVQADIAALNNLSAVQVNAEVVDVLRTDTIPDSYAADGAQPTIAQAMLAIHQFLTEKSVSGTTVTVNKPDGTTAVMTFTLNNATTPTSITRAT